MLFNSDIKRPNPTLTTMSTLLSLAGKPMKVRRLLSIRRQRPSLLTTIHKLHHAERERQRLQALEEERCYYISWMGAYQAFGISF